MTLLLSRDKIVIMKTPKELEYARKKGLVFYNTGKPCPNGHKARRYTKSSKCVECVRLRAKVYGKVYFQKNMGYDWGQVQGAGYWCYQGKTLRELVTEK